MTSAADRKDILRQQVRGLRRDWVASLTPHARDALHRNLAEILAASIAAPACLAAYASFGSEIDPVHCVAWAADQGSRILYPRFKDRDAPMEMAPGPLAGAGPFGFPQPDMALPSALPDIVLVPLVAADANGHRIGQGKGHYDRYLSRVTAENSIFTIGLSYDIQIVSDIPFDPWDVSLDAIATPTRWILPAVR